MNGPDYEASLGRIGQVATVLASLCIVHLAPPGSDADVKWGIDGWFTRGDQETSFGIGTQTGNWPTITVTGTRKSGYPPVEALIPERIRTGQPYPKLTITAYGEASAPDAPYTRLNAVRMAGTVDLHSLPDHLWTQKLIRSRAEEGNSFKFIKVTDIRRAGYKVLEWDPAKGWRT